MKGKRNEVDFQRDKTYLKALKQQEDDGELMLYYFDQSGFNTTPCAPYGWQRIGETRQIPCHRSKHMNVLGFLNRKNDLFFHISEQSVTTDTVVKAFDAFVETYAGKYEKTKVPCLVMLPFIVAAHSMQSWRSGNSAVFAYIFFRLIAQS